MTNVFFIGDLHFGHHNILKFCPKERPFSSIEEHNEELVKRWNDVVKIHDKVFVLGDFAMGKSNLHYAGRLNGKKHLIMGNHDGYDVHEYLNDFYKLDGCVQYKKGILTHVPVHPSELTRFRFNIHGHLHHICLDDPRYINVSAEQINLTPIHWDEIKKRTEV